MAKRTDRNLIVGLDIGTSKVVAIVGEIRPDGALEIIGIGSHPSRGLKKGVVDNIESTVQSIQRAVEEAEDMLEHAKNAGRDRVGLLDRALTWDRLDRTLDLSERVLGLLRADHLPRGVLHAALGFARERAKAEAGDFKAALWWPRWRYHRARFEDRIKDETVRAALRPMLEALLPPPGLVAVADAELAASFALWRSR